MQSMHPYENSISNQPPEQSPPVNKDRFFTSQGWSLFASLTVTGKIMITSNILNIEKVMKIKEDIYNKPLSNNVIDLMGV